MEASPNLHHYNGSDAITTEILNTTMDDTKHAYDYVGAMQFIVTTLAVYSLMGISGMLILRIRRRATRTHRVVTIREEHLEEYIKLADDLKLAGHRQKLKIEASRMVHHLQNIERQRSHNGNSRRSSGSESTTPLDSSSWPGQSRLYIESPKAYMSTSSSRGRKLILSTLPEEYLNIPSRDCSIEQITNYSNHRISGGSSNLQTDMTQVTSGVPFHRILPGDMTHVTSGVSSNHLLSEHMTQVTTGVQTSPLFLKHMTQVTTGVQTSPLFLKHMTQFTSGVPSNSLLLEHMTQVTSGVPSNRIPKGNSAQGTSDWMLYSTIGSKEVTEKSGRVVLNVHKELPVKKS